MSGIEPSKHLMQLIMRVRMRERFSTHSKIDVYFQMVEKKHF